MDEWNTSATGPALAEYDEVLSNAAGSFSASIVGSVDAIERVFARAVQVPLSRAAVLSLAVEDLPDPVNDDDDDL